MTKHLTDLGQIWPKYLPLATLAYNTFNTPNIVNNRPYELVFSRKPKLETIPDIKVTITFKDHYTLLNKRLQYLRKLSKDFRSKRLVMINKDRNFFQYNSGDLVCKISQLTSQLRISSRKVGIKHVGTLVIYKIIDPHNYLLMTLNGKILRRLFDHERLKPATIRTSQGNVCNLPQLKQLVNIGMKV